jgi:hypothetical protein
VDSDGEHRVKDLVWLINELIYEREHVAAPEGREPEGWQPIETAPKDGYILAVGCNGTQRVIPVHWVSDFFEGDTAVESGWYLEGMKLARPTHWMPLPAPPASALRAPERERMKEKDDSARRDTSDGESPRSAASTERR